MKEYREMGSRAMRQGRGQGNMVQSAWRQGGEDKETGWRRQNDGWGQRGKKKDREMGEEDIEIGDRRQGNRTEDRGTGRCVRGRQGDKRWRDGGAVDRGGREIEELMTGTIGLKGWENRGEDRKMTQVTVRTDEKYTSSYLSLWLEKPQMRPVIECTQPELQK